MPLSKKRKPKRRSTSRPQPIPSTVAPAAAGKLGGKKKISRQQIVIYLISIIMILSLAIGYLVNGPTTPPAPTATPVVSEVEGEQPAGQDQPAPDAAATAEPTAEQ